MLATWLTVKYAKNFDTDIGIAVNSRSPEGGNGENFRNIVRTKYNLQNEKYAT